MIQGKTKTLEPYENGLRVTTKNSLTANDASKQAEANVAEYKTRQTCSIFEFLNQYDIPTHYIKQIDDTSFLVRECSMFPIECVSRKRAYGSFLKRYPEFEEGMTFGWLYNEFFHKLAYIPESNELISEDLARERYMRWYNPPDGEWITEVITDPLIVFNWSKWRDAKREPNDKKGFDMQFYHPKAPISVDGMKDYLYRKESDIAPHTYDVIVDQMGKIYTLLSEAWKQFNVELVDIKLEFGFCKETRQVVLADVVDNDSWRIWPEGDVNRQLDKQSFRDNEPISDVEKKYQIVTEYTDKFPTLGINL